MDHKHLCSLDTFYRKTTTIQAPQNEIILLLQYWYIFCTFLSVPLKEHFCTPSEENVLLCPGTKHVSIGMGQNWYLMRYSWNDKNMYSPESNVL